MKKPKFVGIKKGYDALFIGEQDRLDSTTHRIRVMKDDGTWTWDWANEKRRFKKVYLPCWWSGTLNPIKALRQMESYDRVCNRRTIFLGYIKNTR